MLGGNISDSFLQLQKTTLSGKVILNLRKTVGIIFQFHVRSTV